MIKQVWITGYPFEFLLARIGVRRRTLIENLIFFRRQPEMIPYFDITSYNLTFRKELGFCFFKLSESYRRMFKNVFLVFELSSLVNMIRYALYENISELKKIYMGSFFSAQIGENLIKKQSFGEKLSALCDYLSDFNKDFSELPEIFTKHGLREFEKNFTRFYLEGLLKDKKNTAEVKEFIGIFIDLYNINAIFKKIRWDSNENIVFINGGSLTEKRIIEMINKNKGFKPLSYLRKQITHWAHKGKGSEIYYFLHYILLLYLENINLNILINTLEYERDTVERELL